MSHRKEMAADYIELMLSFWEKINASGDFV